MPDRREITIEELHRDLQAHAKTLSELTLATREVLDHQQKTDAAFDLDRAVRAERMEAVNQRFARMEEAIKSLREDCANDIKEIHAQREKFQSRIWIAIGAIMSSFIAAVSKWLFGGGLAPPS